MVDLNVKPGQKLIVIRDLATRAEWEGIGKIKILFKIGEIVTLHCRSNDYREQYSIYLEEYTGWYPRELFKVYNPIHELW